MNSNSNSVLFKKTLTLNILKTVKNNLIKHHWRQDASMAASYEMDMEHRQYLYVFSLYQNPDLDDRLFDYLLTSMVAVQAEDERASFLFVGDLNGHHQEWLGSTTTNRHGVAAIGFPTVSVSDQLVVGLTHARGGTH